MKTKADLLNHKYAFDDIDKEGLLQALRDLEKSYREQTAKALFEKLDFHIIKSGDWCIVYGWAGFPDNAKYVFWLDTQEVTIQDMNPLSLDKMNAIRQQMIELGWIK